MLYRPSGAQLTRRINSRTPLVGLSALEGSDDCSTADMAASCETGLDPAKVLKLSSPPVISGSIV